MLQWGQPRGGTAQVAAVGCVVLQWWQPGGVRRTGGGQRLPWGRTRAIDENDDLQSLLGRGQISSGDWYYGLSRHTHAKIIRSQSLDGPTLGIRDQQLTREGRGKAVGME